MSRGAGTPPAATTAGPAGEPAPRRAGLDPAVPTGLDAAERLASVGRLARGLAHELNNPLAVVLANLGFVAEVLDAPPGGRADEADVRAAIREALEAGARMRTILRDLQAFGRDDLDPGPADLVSVLRRVRHLVEPEAGPRARLRVSLPEAPLFVQGSPGRLAQVFGHLLLQAATAIPVGQPDAHEIQVEVRRDGASVVAEVRDTGAAIPAALLPHLFDPYHGSEHAALAADRSRGLGLAACWGVVVAAGGTMTAESGPGGTVFRIVLRAATSETRAALRVLPRAPRRPRVLVVDADPLRCASLYRGLAPRFDVAPHTTGRAALALLDAGEPFDAIVCDAALPDAPADRLHAEVRERAGEALAAAIVFLVGDDVPPPALAFLAAAPTASAPRTLDPAALADLVAARCAPGPR